MNTLVIGGTGLVGAAITEQFKKAGHTVISASRKSAHSFDLENPASIDALLQQTTPDVVILSAAYTHVDGCEEKKEYAWKVNVDGTQAISTACDNRIKLVYVSTDYVFDGKNGPYTEDALPNPLNWYGKTKLAAEQLTQQHSQNLILRTTNVYDLGSDTKNFAARCIQTFKEGKTLKCPVDQYATPTWAQDFGLATRKLVEKNAAGIYNVVGPDYLNRVEFAQKVAKAFNYEASIESLSTAAFAQTAARPLKGGLTTEKLRSLISTPLHSLDTALELLKKDPSIAQLANP